MLVSTIKSKCAEALERATSTVKICNRLLSASAWLIPIAVIFQFVAVESAKGEFAAGGPHASEGFPSAKDYELPVSIRSASKEAGIEDAWKNRTNDGTVTAIGAGAAGISGGLCLRTAMKMKRKDLSIALTAACSALLSSTTFIGLAAYDESRESAEARDHFRFFLDLYFRESGERMGESKNTIAYSYLPDEQINGAIEDLLSGMPLSGVITKYGWQKKEFNMMQSEIRHLPKSLREQMLQHNQSINKRGE